MTELSQSFTTHIYGHDVAEPAVQMRAAFEQEAATINAGFKKPVLELKFLHSSEVMQLKGQYFSIQQPWREFKISYWWSYIKSLAHHAQNPAVVGAVEIAIAPAVAGEAPQPVALAVIKEDNILSNPHPSQRRYAMMLMADGQALAPHGFKHYRVTTNADGSLAFSAYHDDRSLGQVLFECIQGNVTADVFAGKRSTYPRMEPVNVAPMRKASRLGWLQRLRA
ncbi:MAG: hypothetical protein KGQ41_07025 [Alphaproteobacteria bacterium]|nr:hypothetical protein [Alphaproteobacteria bacterium]